MGGQGGEAAGAKRRAENRRCVSKLLKIGQRTATFRIVVVLGDIYDIYGGLEE